jgi:NADH-quinone oxidoreductase subunit J
MLEMAQASPLPSAEVLTPILFLLFAGLTCASAWAIVVSQNIVRIAVYLLLTLCGVAGVYFLLHAELLAAVQLIVYVGGTLILIVFGVMLTSRSPFLQLRARKWEVALGVVLGLVIAGTLLLALAHTKLGPGSAGPAAEAVSGAGDYRRVETIGKALLSGYVMPFEAAGVLLLVVMIAAAYMARRRAQ